MSITFLKFWGFVLFRTFPGLEICILQYHDFPRFSITVRTLYIYIYIYIYTQGSYISLHVYIYVKCLTCVKGYSRAWIEKTLQGSTDLLHPVSGLKVRVVTGSDRSHRRWLSERESNTHITFLKTFQNEYLKVKEHVTCSRLLWQKEAPLPRSRCRTVWSTQSRSLGHRDSSCQRKD